jgi:FkbM family methyltransferase
MEHFVNPSRPITIKPAERSFAAHNIEEIDLLRLPIIASPLRGYWWHPASRGKILSILGGAYEPEQTAVFMRWVHGGSTVLDIGAHAGYYTLLASILAGESGDVWAFEPEPHNAAFLRRHMRLNGRRNVHVEELAVCASSGTARFARGTGSGTGHLAEDGDLEVRTVSLADFCAARGIQPTVLKIDVEGAEAAVLHGARDVIAEFKPIVFLSTHGDDIHRRCLSVMRAAGYSFFPILGGDVESAGEILCLPNGTVA